MNTLKEKQVIEAIKAVTKVNERTIRDVWNSYQQAVVPLPGTIQHMIYMCWRMAEELGYEQETD